MTARVGQENALGGPAVGLEPPSSHFTEAEARLGRGGACGAEPPELPPPGPRQLCPRGPGGGAARGGEPWPLGFHPARSRQLRTDVLPRGLPGRVSGAPAGSWGRECARRHHLARLSEHLAGTRAPRAGPMGRGPRRSGAPPVCQARRGPSLLSYSWLPPQQRNNSLPATAGETEAQGG